MPLASKGSATVLSMHKLGQGVLLHTGFARFPLIRSCVSACVQEEFREIDAEFKAMGVMVERESLFEGTYIYPLSLSL